MATYMSIRQQKLNSVNYNRLFRAMEGNPDEAAEPVFSINAWFNNLPIRIIGTPDCPYFYAVDVGKVLGMKKHTFHYQEF